MYRETTNGIQVDVEPQFLPDESKPDLNYFVFSYTVKITNLGSIGAKLVSRHWVIRDGTGNTREVKGQGVVGEQPTLNPGETYQYTSFCPLTTPTGNMRGSYLISADSGEQFSASIPLFFLRTSPSPEQLI